jgi:glycolate oxidase
MLPTTIIRELESIVGESGVIADPAELLVYECDALTIAKNCPDVVVLPENTQQAAEVIRTLNKHDVPLVPRGAGTSLSGGCLPLDGGAMVGASRMNRILEVDHQNRVARVQAGVVNLHVTNRVMADGYHYAPDPSSQPACTIGGNIATNSGGPHTLKYGVTVNHVRGLTLVTPEGEIIETGGTAQELPGYDLTGLIVGSEGTFGMITEAVLLLTRNPPSFRTCLALFDEVDDATNAVSGIIAAGLLPAALEMMDRIFIGAVEEAEGLGLHTDAEGLLIVELDGIEAGLDDEAAAVEKICRENHCRSIETASDPDRRAKLWKGRKRAFGAIGRLSSSYCTQDGVAPRSKLPMILRKVREVAQKYDIRIGNVFHAGDGNIHPILLFDERDQDQVIRVLDAGDEILKACVEVGGSVTGEHGIGVEKIDHLRLMFSDYEIENMKKIRCVFDPNERSNTYKTYPTPGRTVNLRHPVAKAYT